MCFIKANMMACSCRLKSPELKALYISFYKSNTHSAGVLQFANKYMTKGDSDWALDFQV